MCHDRGRQADLAAVEPFKGPEAPDPKVRALSFTCTEACLEVWPFCLSAWGLGFRVYVGMWLRPRLQSELHVPEFGFAGLRGLFTLLMFHDARAAPFRRASEER